MPARRRLPGLVLSALVGLPLLLFIAFPVGAMLVESLHVPAPVSPASLAEMTASALERMPGGEPEDALDRWWDEATPAERVDSLALAFALHDAAVAWDRSRRYDDQRVAAEAALEALPADQRARIEAALPLAHAALHKRQVIAATLRGSMPEDDLDRLRSGQGVRFGLDQYGALFESPRLRRAALNSVLLASVSATLVTAIAFAIGYAINRRAVPRPNAVRMAVLLPLISPPVMIAFATLLVFGRQGLVTKSLLQDALGLTDANTVNIYGFGGILFAQVLGLVAPAFIIIDSALARQDGRVEESAASLGASTLQIFLRVTLPMARPGLVRAYLLVFVLSMTDFGNPLVIGQNWPVLAAEIYGLVVGTRDLSLAMALCVWLIVPACLLYGAFELFGRRRRFDGAGIQPSLPVPRAARLGLGALASVFAGTLFLLFALVIAGAFTRFWGVDYGLTLDHFRGLRPGGAFRETGFGSADLGVGVVLDSLRVALIAAPIGGLLGVLTAFMLERLRPPGAQVLGFLAMLPAVLPGLVFGLGYLAAFNAPLGRPELALTGTLGILVINIVFGNLFVGVLAGRAALQRLDSGVEEAAEGLGASLGQRFLRVVLPVMRRAFLLGTLYVFVDALTTLSSIIFLVTGKWQMAAVLIFNQAGGSDYGSAAAKSVLILLLVAVTMAGLSALDRQPGSSPGGRRLAARPRARLAGARPAAWSAVGR